MWQPCLLHFQLEGHQQVNDRCWHGPGETSTLSRTAPVPHSGGILMTRFIFSERQGLKRRFLMSFCTTVNYAPAKFRSILLEFNGPITDISTLRLRLYGACNGNTTILNATFMQKVHATLLSIIYMTNT